MDVKGSASQTPLDNIHAGIIEKHKMIKCKKCLQTNEKENFKKPLRMFFLVSYRTCWKRKSNLE